MNCNVSDSMASAKYQKLRRLAYYLVTPLMWNPGYGKFNSENCVLVMVSSLVLPTGLWLSCPLTNTLKWVVR